MAPEYRFDYKKAKPNRFAQDVNIDVRWTAEKFVEAEKEKPKVKASSNGRSTPTKASQSKAKKPAAKKKSALKKTSKPTKKTQSPKRKKKLITIPRRN